jgi:predicted RNase H-like HicB family nuclease
MKNYIKTDGLDNVLELQLNVLVFQQGDYYVAYCPSLNLSSYGDTIEEAKIGFDEVMEAYLEDCKENGSLHEDLIRNGWNVNIQNHKKAEPPAMVELNIPAGSLRQQFNENWSVPIC